MHIIILNEAQYVHCHGNNKLFWNCCSNLVSDALPFLVLPLSLNQYPCRFTWEYVSPTPYLVPCLSKVSSCLFLEKLLPHSLSKESQTTTVPSSGMYIQGGAKGAGAPPETKECN